MVRLLPKKMSKSRKCDGTAPHINTIFPPFPSSIRSKKPDSLWLSPELCSFSTEDQLHLHLLSGQTLHCLWAKYFFQGGSQGSESEPCCTASALTGCIYLVNGKIHARACPLAVCLFSWENNFNELFSQWKGENGR